MIPIVLVAAAAVALGWPHVAPLLERARAAAPLLTPRHAIGLALVVAALAYASMPDATPTPAPGPPDPGPLSLKGLFAGPTASEDAALIGAMCTEIGDEIQFSSGKPDGYLSTGIAVDELRRRTRILRCRGISIGDRQPAARDAIANYLDRAVGEPVTQPDGSVAYVTSGGPLTPEQRSAWVAAYRDLGRAASDAAR
jgi:hypothetical protein